MKFKSSIPEIELKVEKLRSYFEQAADGEEISWMRVEADTQISMDLKGNGRDLARRALLKLKRPYEAVRGVGVRLSSPENAIAILKGRFVRIDTAVLRADKTQQRLTDRHLEQMTPRDQRAMIIAAGFFGAVRTIANQAKTQLLKSS